MSLFQYVLIAFVAWIAVNLLVYIFAGKWIRGRVFRAFIGPEGGAAYAGEPIFIGIGTVNKLWNQKRRELYFVLLPIGWVINVGWIDFFILPIYSPFLNVVLFCLKPSKVFGLFALFNALIFGLGFFIPWSIVIFAVGYTTSLVLLAGFKKSEGVLLTAVFAFASGSSLHVIWDFHQQIFEVAQLLFNLLK